VKNIPILFLLQGSTITVTPLPGSIRLTRVFEGLRKDAAVGIDGVTKMVNLFVSRKNLQDVEGEDSLRS
jgi:hypothetical protein